MRRFPKGMAIQGDRYPGLLNRASGPEIVEFRAPPTAKLIGKGGGFAPHFFPWVLRYEGPFRSLNSTVSGPQIVLSNLKYRFHTRGLTRAFRKGRLEAHDQQRISRPSSHTRKFQAYDVFRGCWAGPMYSEQPTIRRLLVLCVDGLKTVVCPSSSEGHW